MTAIEIRVPNIGDFHDVPVVDVLVKPGDTVKIEDPLVALESDKATMEVPSSHAGVVQSVAIKIGDKVSEGSMVLTLVAAESGSQAQTNGFAPKLGIEAAPAPAAVEARTQTTATLDLRVPDIGDFRDIPVIEVLVKPGDRIEREAPLVTLESEKASMDVPASDAGIVRDVLLKVGDRVSQGALVARIETTSGPSATAPVTATAPALATAPAVQTAPPVEVAPSEPSVRGTSAIVHASPSIRRFARELGVDLGAVRGSGPKARVTREDVQDFVKAALAAPAARPASSEGAAFTGLPAWPKIDFAQFGPIERVPLSRIRKLSGPNLHRNWLSIPHVTNNEEADVTDLEAFRKQLNAENPSAKVTMLAFVMKAVVMALRLFPDVNSSLDGDELVRKNYYNLGFAADTPNGLMVPVLKGVDRKGVLDVARDSASLAAKARDGKLTLGDMQGATFTISSLGGIGGTSFTPIVNAPEVAILGLSRATLKPVWDGAAFVPRLMLPLSLSYDHRVIDGALAARFNAALAKTLGDLRRAML